MTHTEPLISPLERASRLRSKSPPASAKQFLLAKPVLAPFGVTLALLAGGGLWLYFQSSQLTAIVVIASCVAALVAGIIGVYRYCLALSKARLAERTSEWENMETLLRAQMAEQTRREQELLTEYTKLKNESSALVRTHTELSEELDRRKQAEKALSLQRQDLARSKDVLELHVQARTEAMEKMQRRHELILDSAGEGICGLNTEGNIAFVNPAAARILGRSIDKMVGRPFKDYFPSVALAPTPRNGETRSEAVSEVTLSRPDGSSSVLEYSRSPVKEGQRSVGEVFLFKDITERKQTEQALAVKAAELARSNAELEQFAFVASHDMQEPLRKIQAFGDRLKVKCEGIDLGDGRQYLDRMQNAAARMRGLIDDLLTFSRVISRTEPFVEVDLNTVTREVLTDLEVRIERSGATVEVAALPKIDADPMQMRQLLQNLIGNALKFHEPGGKPVVKVAGRIIDKQADLTQTALLRRRALTGEKSDSKLYCELTVQDNGIGFEEKYLDRIFVVFQRLHGKQEYEGTGIGLAVCRRIVDRHGGSITAQSKPGAGATFIVMLPVNPQAKPGVKP